MTHELKHKRYLTHFVIGGSDKGGSKDLEEKIWEV